MIRLSTPTEANCGTCHLPVTLNHGHQAAIAHGRQVYHQGCLPRHLHSLFRDIPCADCHQPVTIKTLSWRIRLAIRCDRCLERKVEEVVAARLLPVAPNPGP